MIKSNKILKDIEKVVASALPNKTLICTQPKHIQRWVKGIARAVYDSIELNEEKMKDLLPDLVEKHFPKGKCDERGQAMVLGAMFMIEILKAKPIKIRRDGL